MRTTDVPKHNLIYGKSFNEVIDSSESKSTTFYKDARLKLTFESNKDKAITRIEKDNSIFERPFLFIRNAIIINDFYPNRDEWLALITYRNFRSNYTKIHWIVNFDMGLYNEYSKAFIEALEAVYRNGGKEYIKYSIPKIITNLPRFTMDYGNQIRDIDKDNMIKIYSQYMRFDDGKTFDISDANHKKTITIKPKSPDVMISDIYRFRGEYSIRVNKWEGHK